MSSASPSCPTQVYYWPKNFVMRSCRFEQGKRDKPYQRLSATLIANAHRPFLLQAGEENITKTRIALLSPYSQRQRLHIDGGDGFMFDVDITTEHYRRLKPLLPHTGSSRPPKHIANGILDRLASLQGKPIDACQAVDLFEEVMALLTAGTSAPRARDPRIREILDIIERSNREELTVSGLARRVGLSESRLRSLVQKELGCSLSRYLRWATAWKTAQIWHPDMTLTEAAHAVGFHDLSHANRTFVELFGLAPSRMLKSDDIYLERWEKPSSC